MLLSIFNVASMDTDIWRHATQLINWYASLYSMGYLASLAYISQPYAAGQKGP